MPVNFYIPHESKIFPVNGIEIGVAKAGLKEENRADLTVFRFSEDTVVWGIFTKNFFRAAPVKICQKHLRKNSPITALVINTGYANAGTGIEGISKAKETCSHLGKILGVSPEQILPFSTGVVLESLPLEKLLAGLPVAVQNLNKNNWLKAAYAIMTTDTLPKVSSKKEKFDGKTVTFTGISKGSGMICPKMATMLGFIGTDASISKNILKKLTYEISELSFNRITVDGDTSTNDSFVIVATGKSDIVIQNENDKHYPSIRRNLIDVAIDLAKKIVRDGEGVTKFIEICIWNAKNSRDALKVAYSIANSPLVKTAFYSSELNFGRILVAIGFSEVENLDVDLINIYLNNMPIFIKGKRYTSYKKEKLYKIIQGSEMTLHVNLGMGTYNEKIYTCDMSHEYISINAEYNS